MNKDLLLAEAKRRYPKGTLYVPTMRGSKKTTDIASGVPSFDSNGAYISDSILGTSLYHVASNRWAKIISSPEQKITYNYLIL